MKKHNLAATALAFAMLAVLVIGACGEKQAELTTAGILPASLDSQYPPNAPGPLYLMAMYEMATPFSGMITDLSEGDVANAQANFESFKAQYLRISKLVPEWEKYYPIAPVDELGLAMTSGDQGKIMAAIDNIGKTCNHCHFVNMVPVQHKFHWGDFGMLTVADPITGSDLPYARFKLMMEADFSGIGTDLIQGQRENALVRFDGFEKRFKAFKEVCVACHASERKYFVDSGITGMIENLKLKLNEENIDPRAVGEILQGIGQESCFKCHLVHVPAAYAKHQ